MEPASRRQQAGWEGSCNPNSASWTWCQGQGSGSNDGGPYRREGDCGPARDTATLLQAAKARGRWKGASPTPASSPNSNANSSSKSDSDSAPGTDPGAGAGQADGEDVMIHAKGGLSGCETTNQNKSWAEVTYAQRNRVGLRSPPGLTRKGSRKFQTTKSIVYPQALPTQFSVLFVGEYLQTHQKAASCQTQWLRQLWHWQSTPGLAWLTWAGLI